jgi:pimeloyl-ACP methyl ester carboxylesterase
MKTTAFLLTMLLPAVVSAQQKPTTGYAPVNGLKMYYEVHGSGEPVVLLHGAFMTITNNWDGWIGELSKTRKVIAVEMQGHGRTADIERDINSENLADDVAALLDHLKIPKADLIGYSMGGGVAMQCAIRHPDKVRKVVVISSTFRRDGMVKEALDLFPKLTACTAPLKLDHRMPGFRGTHKPAWIYRIRAKPDPQRAASCRPGSGSAPETALGSLPSGARSSAPVDVVGAGRGVARHWAANSSGVR